jgi:hypothetical protein
MSRAIVTHVRREQHQFALQVQDQLARAATPLFVQEILQLNYVCLLKSTSTGKTQSLANAGLLRKY